MTLKHVAVTGLALAALVSHALAQSRDPAAGNLVKAQVYGASHTAAVLLKAGLETGDDPDRSVECLQYAAIAGFGEVMGWGQDRFKDVEPGIVTQIVSNWQQGFRYLEESLGENGDELDPDERHAVAMTLAGFFDRISEAVRVPADAPDRASRRRQEVHNLAAMFSHHLAELRDSPLVPDVTVRIALVIRHITAGQETFETQLVDQPELRARVEASLAALRTLSEDPPSCSGQDCLDAICDQVEPLFQAIATASQSGASD